MDIVTKVIGLMRIGLKPLLQGLLFSARRDIAKARTLFQKPELQIMPNHLRNIEKIRSGYIFMFDNADLEVRFLTEDMIRLTWRPGILPLPYAIAKEDWDVVEVDLQTQDSGWIVGKKDVSVYVDNRGSVTFKIKDTPFREELPPIMKDGGWHHRTFIKGKERFFGLGLRSSSLDLRGKKFAFWNTEVKGSYGPNDDPLYLCIPVYITIGALGTYLVFFENTHKGEIEFGDMVEARFLGGAFREYVIVGTPKTIMDRFTELTGRPYMPPKWALGFHQSRWSYMSEQEVRDVLSGFEKHDLPLSAIHVDIDYMDDFRIFTNDKSRFPDFRGLTESLNARGVHLVVNHDPGVKKDKDYKIFQEGMARGFFVRYLDDKLVEGPVWPGQCVFPDFTDARVREWWGEKYKVFVDWGVSGVWHDMNEPAVFAGWGCPTLPDNARHSFEGRGGNHIEAHNIYGLLEVMAGYQGLKRLRPEKRPWVLSRSGWAGMQRWSWNWTGDCESNFWTLAQTVRQAISLGLSGSIVTGSDIGGFGGDPSEELFIRWFELGVFLPFFRVHSAFFTKRREPWCFGGSALEILRKLLKLRYLLLPYLYTIAWQSHKTGCPMIRPIWWERQEERLLICEDEFLLGDVILVAPILIEGSSKRDVIFPFGGWYYWWDGNLIKEASTRVDAPFGMPPVFVRSSAIVPTEEDGRIILQVFPDENGIAHGFLYSDDGDGFGDYRYEEITVEIKRGHPEISRRGEGVYREVEVELMIHSR